MVFPRLVAYLFDVRLASAHSPSSTAPLGALLRHWRRARHVSQHDLALKADTSARHVSFVETGRARPSRDMVTRLAEALEIPLRERNALLVAAGYAPLYRETGLTAPEMEAARRAVEFILRQQEPYPAIVVSRRWELLMANKAAAALFQRLLGGMPRESNMLRLVLRPDLVRPFVSNWEEVAAHMVQRLRQEMAWSPHDDAGHALLAEVLSYPGVPTRWQTHEVGSIALPMLTVDFRKGDLTLRFFTTYTTFGTPLDLTLSELRIESFFPADEPTAAACADLG